MRNNPTTITTETIAENIVRNGQNTAGIPPTAEVARVKGRLDRIAQLTGVDKSHVRSGQSAELIFAYEDKLKRGVYDAEKSVSAVLVENA